MRGVISKVNSPTIKTDSSLAPTATISGHTSCILSLLFTWKEGCLKKSLNKPGGRGGEEETEGGSFERKTIRWII